MPSSDDKAPTHVAHKRMRTGGNWWKALIDVSAVQGSLTRFEQVSKLRSSDVVIVIQGVVRCPLTSKDSTEPCARRTVVAPRDRL